MAWNKTATPTRERVDVIGDFVAQLAQDLLDGKAAPWAKPWTGVPGGRPGNPFTGNKYRGTNVWITSLTAMRNGWSGGMDWGTYANWQGVGGQVRKREKGTRIVKFTLKRYPDRSGMLNADGSRVMVDVPIFSYNTVFHRAQIEGAPEPEVVAPRAAGPDPDPAAEAIVADYLKRGKVSLRHEPGDAAYYSPPTHGITMPERWQFADGVGYYATLFHECGHSTGHSTLLKRPGVTGESVGFGSANYAEEELVAELTAATVLAELGLSDVRADQQTAAYLAGWGRRLKEDPKVFQRAAREAQKAVDLILPAGAAPDLEQDV
jgi:antirestriction protein ArdC